MKLIQALLLAATLGACQHDSILPTGMLYNFTPNYPRPAGTSLYLITLDGEPFMFRAPLLVRDGCVYVMNPGREFLLGCGKVVTVELRTP